MEKVKIFEFDNSLCLTDDLNKLGGMTLEKVPGTTEITKSGYGYFIVNQGTGVCAFTPLIARRNEFMLSGDPLKVWTVATINSSQIELFELYTFHIPLASMILSEDSRKWKSFESVYDSLY